MTTVEIKASVFDILKEMEGLQVNLTELNNKKNELLKELENAKKDSPVAS